MSTVFFRKVAIISYVFQSDGKFSEPSHSDRESMFVTVKLSLRNNK